MKRIGGLSILILMVSVLLPFHSAADAAERKPVNGVYQVELSFQSEGAASQEVLFGNKAELTVKEGRYSLSVPVKYQDVIKKITVKQSGSQLKSSLNADENLVQFDIKNIQEKFILEGTFQWSADDIPIAFSRELVINKNSLPKEEQQAAGEQDAIGSAGRTDGKAEPSARDESVNSNKSPIIKKTERWSYTPRPSRHSKEAAEAREKQQAAEAARKAASEEEQLVFDRTQDEPAIEQPVKEQSLVKPAVVQVAEQAAVAPTRAQTQTAEGPAIPFELAKVGILFLACILSGVLFIRRMINRKKEVISK